MSEEALMQAIIEFLDDGSGPTVDGIVVVELEFDEVIVMQ